MKILINVLLLLICYPVMAGAKIESIRFATKETQPVIKVPEDQKPLYDILKKSKDLIPEGNMILGSLLLGGKKFKLTPQQKKTLTENVVRIYSEIDKDPIWKNIPSVLPETISEGKHDKKGHYFLYLPEKVDSETECLIFLHGYGGNFKYYLWILQQEFPDKIILVPSMGISWGKGSEAYLNDMLKDFIARKNIQIKQPWLISISAGGPTGFKIYNDYNKKFKGLVCIASAPRKSTISKIKRDLNILMINGKSDRRFPIDVVKKRVIPLKQIRNFEFKELDGDHFFLFTQQKETFKHVKKFMNK